MAALGEESTGYYWPGRQYLGGAPKCCGQEFVHQ